MDNSINIKIISYDEFVVLVKATIIHNWNHYDKNNIVDLLVADGFPKMEKENIAKFMENMMETHYIWIDTVAVDFGDSEFMWLVSGSRAILMKKQR